MTLIDLLLVSFVLLFGSLLLSPWFWRLGREGYVPAPDIGWCGRRQGRRQGRERPLLQEEHDASSNCNMRNIGWSVAMVGGIHTRKSHRAVPWRDECGRERVE
jgi:hypothetical protein